MIFKGRLALSGVLLLGVLLSRLGGTEHDEARKCSKLMTGCPLADCARYPSPMHEFPHGKSHTILRCTLAYGCDTAIALPGRSDAPQLRRMTPTSAL